jgi:uncharacterized protein YhaN
MRIVSFHIDGFGIFCDHGVRDLPPGLVVFIGENESGKTTLMEFFRTVLFGIPRERNRNTYLPLCGGKHGGRLQVLMEDGRRLTVERLGRQVSIAEEGKAPDQAEPSEQLLGGIDRNVFERVFAIGLDDLQGLDVLTLEKARARLLAATAGLGAASLPRTMEHIKGQLDSLLKRGARKPLINQLQGELKRTQGRISELHGQAAEYAQCRERGAQLEEEIRELGVEQRKARERLLRTGQLSNGREAWVKLCNARSKVKQLQFAKGFPTNGLDRLDNLKKEIDVLERNRDVRKDEVERLKGQIQEFEVDETLVQHQEEIQILVGKRQAIDNAVKDLPVRGSEMLHKEKEFQKRLRDLGEGWSPERLAEVNTSVQVRQEVRRFSKKLEAAERNLEQLRTRLTDRETEVREAKLALEEKDKLLDTFPTRPSVDEARLQRQCDAVRGIRSSLLQRERLSAVREEKITRHRLAEAQLQSLEREMEERLKYLPVWSLIVTLAAAVVGAVLLVTKVFPGLAVVVLSLGLLLFGLLYVIRGYQRHTEVRRLSRLEARIKQEKETTDTLASELNGLEEQFKKAGENAEQVAQSASVECPGDLDRLDRLDAKLRDLRETLVEYRALERERNDVEKRCTDAEKRFVQSKKESQKAQREYEVLQGEWKEWLTKSGFNIQVNPVEFEVVLQAVESARDAEGNLREWQARVKQIKDYVSQTRTEISALLDDLGRAPASKEIGVADLDELRNGLNTALGLRQKQSELLARIEEAESEVGRLSNQLDGKQKELDGLFELAAATGEEKFRSVGSAYHELHKYEREIETNTGALLTIAGTPEAQEALEQELRKSDVISLESEKAELEGRLSETEKKTARAQEEIGSLNERLSRMAQDNELGALLLESRRLEEQLSEAIKRWSTLVLCRHLLDEARDVHERERQPQVIREASEFLEMMTSKRYKLITSIDEGEITLEDSALKRKNERAWSGGLADQVYLAIRLGLASEFGRHAESLPLVLDDVLVKFDPTRQLGAAKVILKFADKHQVLLFSCHPSLTQIIEDARKDSESQSIAIAYFEFSDGVIRRRYSAKKD